MKKLSKYINESISFNDEMRNAKKEFSKYALFKQDGSQYSVAFKRQDSDEYVVIKKFVGLKSEMFDLDRDFGGDKQLALKEINSYFTNKEKFIELQAHFKKPIDTYVNEILSKNKDEFVLCRVLPNGSVMTILPKHKDGSATVYGNKDWKWAQENFELTDEDFKMYKDAFKKSINKMVKEQSKRFNKQDESFRIILSVDGKLENYYFDGLHQASNQPRYKSSYKVAIIPWEELLK